MNVRVAKQAWKRTEPALQRAPGGRVVRLSWSGAAGLYLGLAPGRLLTQPVAQGLPSMGNRRESPARWRAV
eukprot:8098798-Alexandrium_andersonii.AAC.1